MNTTNYHIYYIVSTTFFQSVVHRRKAARPPQHHLQQLCCRYKVRTIVRVFFCCPGSCSRRRSSSGKFHTAAWPRLLQPGLIPNNCSESLLPGPGSPGCWYFFAGLPGEFRQPEVRRTEQLCGIPEVPMSRDTAAAWGTTLFPGCQGSWRPEVRTIVLCSPIFRRFYPDPAVFVRTLQDAPGRRTQVTPNNLLNRAIFYYQSLGFWFWRDIFHTLLGYFHEIA